MWQPWHRSMTYTVCLTYCIWLIKLYNGFSGCGPENSHKHIKTVFLLVTTGATIVKLYSCFYSHTPEKPLQTDSYFHYCFSSWQRQKQWSNFLFQFTVVSLVYGCRNNNKVLQWFLLLWPGESFLYVYGSIVFYQSYMVSV